MQNQEAYNKWSETYDTVVNKTRDLEAMAFRRALSDLHFSNVIELGCGTGKNTQWLARKSRHIIATDFSDEMLSRAKTKVNHDNIEFINMDIRLPWKFDTQAELITCSLILEHIENIDFVFQEASQHLAPGGHFYVGELHPLKQYQGSKARFETGSGLLVLECFTHHIADYFQAGKRNKFNCSSVTEWFDEDDKNAPPRVIAFLFRKN